MKSATDEINGRVGQLFGLHGRTDSVESRSQASFSSTRAGSKN
jgi:hypothetical protein